MSEKNAIKDTIDNVRDATKEAMHRSTAEAEHVRRETTGDQMTAGEKLKSVGNEVKNSTQAEIDKTKREVRSHT
jgi:hypothetical protein